MPRAGIEPTLNVPDNPLTAARHNIILEQAAFIKEKDKGENCKRDVKRDRSPVLLSMKDNPSTSGPCQFLMKGKKRKTDSKDDNHFATALQKLGGEDRIGLSI